MSFWPPPPGLYCLNSTVNLNKVLLCIMSPSLDISKFSVCLTLSTICDVSSCENSCYFTGVLLSFEDVQIFVFFFFNLIQKVFSHFLEYFFFSASFFPLILELSYIYQFGFVPQISTALLILFLLVLYVTLEYLYWSVFKFTDHCDQIYYWIPLINFSDIYVQFRNFYLLLFSWFLSLYWYYILLGCYYIILSFF